jgi:uncharacterized protein (UPF0332 family)
MLSLLATNAKCFSCSSGCRLADRPSVFADAAIAGLSADRRFATAYNAALQAANMAIACAGYRIVSKVGHHRVSLESVKLVMGRPADKYADYFETCRRKRNTIDYTFSNVATETEAKEILSQASQFCSEVEDWITKTHPSLKK